MNKLWKFRRLAPLCIGAMTLLVSLASCSKDDEKIIEPDSLTVSTDTLIFSGTSIAQSFTIASTGESWIIEISETGKEWLSVTPLTGKGAETSISVTPSEYNDDFPRHAHLIISQNGISQARIGISQSGAAHAESQLQDSLSLVSLYKATNGNNWSGSGRSDKFPWDLAKPLSQWAGVEIENINGEMRVTALDLSSVSGMKGSIPNEIGYLSELKELQLAADELVGEVPRQLILLDKLRILGMSAAQNSNLKWEITEEYKSLSNLESLIINNVEPNDISTNPLAVIYQIPTLKKLTLCLPYISGAMPSGISALTELEELDLKLANISSLPTDIGELKKLIGLALTVNKVSELPASISNWKSLESLEISNIRSSLVLPSDFKELVNLKNLIMRSLNISFNPNEVLADMSKLEILSLNYNKLDGSIDWLANKPNLQMMQIDQNEGVLYGELPSEIFDYSDLNHFIISSATTAKNEITGNINNIDRLTKLTTFAISNALLTGEVKTPNSPALYYFDLSDNNLVGGLENVRFNDALYTFKVSGNRLSGEIPAELLEHIWDFSTGEEPPTNEQHFHHAGNICPQQAGFGFSNCFSYSVD